MPAINAITAEKLARLVGTPTCPVLIDLRPAPAALLPGAVLRHPDRLSESAQARLGVRDVAAADLVHRRARERGRGLRPMPRRAA